MKENPRWKIEVKNVGDNQFNISVKGVTAGALLALYNGLNAYSVHSSVAEDWAGFLKPAIEKAGISDLPPRLG